MIGFLRNWWRERNRRIFKYWDGARVRRADPIVLFRGLKEAPDFDFDNDVDAAFKHQQEDAILRCVVATRLVFEIPAYDGSSGLTEEETQDVLAGYILWVDALKKNSSPPQTSTGLIPDLSSPPASTSAEDTSQSPPITSSSQEPSPAAPAA